jgi:hypothetical protein
MFPSFYIWFKDFIVRVLTHEKTSENVKIAIMIAKFI